MSYSLKLQTAADTLRGGGVVAYPTEAVWGLGCDPFNHRAIERLLAIKQRDPAKGLILIAASIAQIEPFIIDLNSEQLAQLSSNWPGPYTYLIPANSYVPLLIKGAHSSVALRVSAHRTVVDLCRAFGGPIVSSSANIAGLPAAKWPWQVHRRFATKIDFQLPGVIGAANRPTEIRDLVTDKVIRSA